MYSLRSREIIKCVPPKRQIMRSRKKTGGSKIPKTELEGSFHQLVQSQAEPEISTSKRRLVESDEEFVYEMSVKKDLSHFAYSKSLRRVQQKMLVTV